MSELISGKEAFDAAYNGCEAQWRWTGKDVEWRELEGGTAFSINELKGGACEFRLKPRTITINGIEVPAPFDPKDDDEKENSYVITLGGEKFHWRTSSDYKQVAEALRSVFKPQ